MEDHVYSPSVLVQEAGGRNRSIPETLGLLPTVLPSLKLPELPEEKRPGSLSYPEGKHSFSQYWGLNSGPHVG
jgi:hypothetical protein